ncbi:MAG: DUF5615 family PIN-like protein [Dehalococcoidia bacterium]|nr:DUF5615 family PIN-like protein [Dehalococcoidia bacterium]MDW8007180.1 DUF5615 family PIN-like protein [Thermomicrobium sp.]
MKLLVDENIPRSVVQMLVDVGHDVCTVSTVVRGATDSEVVALAIREDRVIVTADKDFAELAARVPGCPSIVLARLNRVSSPQHFIDCIRRALAYVDRASGLLVVVEPSRIRVRRW